MKTCPNCNKEFENRDLFQTDYSNIDAFSFQAINPFLCLKCYMHAKS